MPMTRLEAVAGGRKGEVFAHLPVMQRDDHANRLAADGVSCTMCHQIQGEKLGTRESFTAGFVVDTRQPFGRRSIFGPFEVDPGRTKVMQSSSEFRPTKASHMQSSELCATCHTLITHTLDPNGAVIGELPEQVPYLEWSHSEYRDRQGCQSCHMPVVDQEMPISAVLGEPRTGFSRHQFRGGNFFIMSMLNRYRDDLGVTALNQDFSANVHRTVRHLETEAAHITIENARISAGRLEAAVVLENRAGHKLPTAYPSRRTLVHFIVQDQGGKTIYESGGLTKAGSIRGNDNDDDPARYESHYQTIENADQVQIYEAVMVDPADRVTTGLLAAIRHIKDNRLMPRGFDKSTAEKDIAVHGQAVKDGDFTVGGDRIRYSAPVPQSGGPFVVRAELCYQPIAYRWARNLQRQDAPEIQRFISMFETIVHSSTVVLAQASARVRPD